MCGIGGQCRTTTPVSVHKLHSLMKRLAHRGPDAKGIWRSEDDLAGFVHCRLSILDLSERGLQPLHSHDDRFCIVYNGEIYNYKSLKQDLIKQGVNFFTETDTEVLLALWAREGVGALAKLRGMFSFAIWDKHNKTLHLVRDPLGIKPLYYSFDNYSISFASEIKALCAIETGLKINAEAVGFYLKWGCIPSPHTLFDNLQSLEPGCVLTWRQDNAKLTAHNYWNVMSVYESNVGTAIVNRDEAVTLTSQTLKDSVKQHLVSDVPVGAFLSGGIDSSSVVSLMRQAGQKDICTFSLIFNNNQLDESRYIRLAASKYHVENHAFFVGSDELEEALPHFLDSLDQPTVDGFNTWLVSRRASQQGLKVVTSGVGGDEFFAGYDSIFRFQPKVSRLLLKIPKVLRTHLVAVLQAFSQHHFGGSRSKKLLQLAQANTMQQAYGAFRQLNGNSEICDILRKSTLVEGAIKADLSDVLAPAGDTLPQQHVLTAWEVRAYLCSQLLADSDIFSMAHGLELRTPLVDKVLTETLAQIDPSCFHRPNGAPKSLLVDSVGDLPEELVHRTKRTFTLPLEELMLSKGLSDPGGLLHVAAGGEWRDFIKNSTVLQLENNFRSGKVHWSRCWLLVVLAHFLARHGDV